MSDLRIGQRVFHRRQDAFGVVEGMGTADGSVLLVKYEWPFDPKWDAQAVPADQLVDAAQVLK